MRQTHENFTDFLSRHLGQRRFRAEVAGLFVLMAFGGCEQQQAHTREASGEQSAEKQNAFSGFKKRHERGREQMETLGEAGGAGEASRARSTAWAIAIHLFQGRDAATAAQMGLSKLQREAGLKDAYIEQRGGAVALLYGRYDGPDDARAVQDLQRIKEMVVDGGKPFEGAVLSPPVTVAAAGTREDMDLSMVASTLGKDAVYTLQVGVYRLMEDREASASELALFRQQAEAAAIALRAQGQEAYYYHGPRSSTVTVGLFGEADLITHTRDEYGQMVKLPRPRFSARVREAMAVSPNNLVNGKTVAGRGGRGNQESGLIRIPR
jgi:hypothetical protein